MTSGAGKTVRRKEADMRRFTVSLSVLAVVFLVAGAALADDVRVIVGFKGAPDKALLAEYSSETLCEVGDAVAILLHPKKVASLRAEADVAYVEEDGVAEAVKGKPGGTTPPPAEEQPWGIERVWGGTSKPEVTGAGVKVAVIDTGIEFAHPDLKNNLAGLSVTYVARTSSANDDNGHGTHVAGIIAAEDNSEGVIGVASGATLYAVKVLDKRGSGYLSNIAQGIVWAGDEGMHIANLSLGAPSGSSTLYNACTYATNLGVLLVAASGNEGDGSASTSEVLYPAAYGNVLSVGATDSGDNLAWFSNTNSDVELSAPGVSVLSTYKGQTYKTLSGTSMASPHVAGVAALIWAEDAYEGRTSVLQELLTRFDDAGTSGRDNGFGFGIVNYSR